MGILSTPIDLVEKDVHKLHVSEPDGESLKPNSRRGDAVDDSVPSHAEGWMFEFQPLQS